MTMRDVVITLLIVWGIADVVFLLWLFLVYRARRKEQTFGTTEIAFSSVHDFQIGEVVTLHDGRKKRVVDVDDMTITVEDVP